MFFAVGDVSQITERAQYLVYLSELPDSLQPMEGQSPADGSYGVCTVLLHWKISYSSGMSKDMRR